MNVPWISTELYHQNINSSTNTDTVMSTSCIFIIMLVCQFFGTMFSSPVQETVITVVLKFTQASGNITFESFNGIPNYFRIGCGKQFYIINRSGIRISFVCTSNMNNLVYNEKPWANLLRITSSFCPNFPHSFLDNESYATKKNWFCAINNRTRTLCCTYQT